MPRHFRVVIVLVLVLVLGFSVAGCARDRHRIVAADSPGSRPNTQALAQSLPLSPPRERLAEMIVESQHKRVWGRFTAYDEVQRIIHRLGPFIREGANQPAVQSSLRMMAADSGISVQEAKERWIRLHEADILLESGGREDAVSVSDAVGVSQWLAGTGRRAGLRVDLAESNRLTARIDALRQRVADLTATPRPPQGGAASPRLESLLNEIEKLRAKRRSIDQRYDPRPAIVVQARYLLRLYPRFPDPAWLLQAYHGGEAGATRTLSKYLGPAWTGSTAHAIRRGNRGGRLSFERVYMNATPKSRAEAFSYLYGRSDDHRYYWWKVRSALEAFEQYRKDSAGFRRRWEQFLPGRAKEAYWYPDPPAASGSLARAVSGTYYAGTPDSSVRPVSKGALLLLADLYHRNGGAGKLIVGDTLLAADDVEFIKSLAAVRDAKRQRDLPKPDPNNLPGGGPRPDFNYHVTGLAFDLRRPSDSRDRKILEFALGWLADRHIIWWRPDDIDSASARRFHYHVVPNPHHRIPLERIGRTGKLPMLPK